jgi:hypothetical protein
MGRPTDVPIMSFGPTVSSTFARVAMWGRRDQAGTGFAACQKRQAWLGVLSDSIQWRVLRESMAMLWCPASQIALILQPSYNPEVMLGYMPWARTLPSCLVVGMPIEHQGLL